MKHCLSSAIHYNIDVTIYMYTLFLFPGIVQLFWNYLLCFEVLLIRIPASIMYSFLIICTFVQSAWNLSLTRCPFGLVALSGPSSSLPTTPTPPLLLPTHTLYANVITTLLASYCICWNVINFAVIHLAIMLLIQYPIASYIIKIV